jgi:RHS repeat-associated protein
VHQHYFYNGYPSQYVATGELITTWVLLDPCNPPREIEFNWQAGNNQPAVSGAYWGENLVTFGTDNTRTRRYMGPLPPVGQWTRLDVPSTFVNLNDQTLTGEGFVVYDGRAWFDRTGKASCTAPIAAAPSSFPSTDVVWFDDDLPSGATGTNWSWDTSQKASGTRSSKDTVTMTPPYTQHYFTGATQPMTAGTGDKFFVYAMLDPCATPAEIMVEFNVGSTWYRGYWGSDDMAAPSKTRIGDLPMAGQWVRLEIPASILGLEGASITGMSFTMPNGRAWFDRVGIAPASSGMMQSLPNPNPSMASSSSSTTTAPPAPPSRRTRMWSWIKRVIFRRDAPPPVAMLIGSPAIAPQDTTAIKQRYSLYTPELSLMAETATSTTTNPPIAYEYIWFDGEPLSQIETATGTTHWYFNDHLGAPLLTTSSAGAVDWRVEREPYGQSYVRNGAERHQPVGLPGQETGESVDRQYNIFRWYRSTFNRYSQPDPLGLTVDIDVYRYVDDDPVNGSDRLGLATKVDCCELAREITEAWKELRRLEKNELKAATRATSAFDFWVRYAGHLTKWTGWQLRLRKLLKKYDDNNCHDDISSARELAEKDYPDFDWSEWRRRMYEGIDATARSITPAHPPSTTGPLPLPWWAYE